MAFISRGSKAAGGTNFKDNTAALASEVNEDFNTIYDEFNSNIHDANVNASADIALTKIADTSAAAANHATTQDPGDSGGQVLATDAEDEIQQLRHQIREIGLGANSELAAASAGWFDRPARGGNLLQNGHFSLFTNAAAATPSFWGATGTPTLSIVTTDPTVAPHSLRIEAAGGTQGINQVLDAWALKASTRYIVGCTVSVNSGTFHLQTSGAAAGTFTDLDVTYTSATARVVSGVFETDGTPSAVTISFLAEDGDDVRIASAFLYECGADPVGERYPQSVTTTTSLNDVGRFVNGSWATVQVAGPADMTITAYSHSKAQVTLAHILTNITVEKDATPGYVAIRATVNGSAIGDYAMRDFAAGEIGTINLITANTIQTTGAKIFRIEGRTSAGAATLVPATPVTGANTNGFLTVVLL